MKITKDNINKKKVKVIPVSLRTKIPSTKVITNTDNSKDTTIKKITKVKDIMSPMKTGINAILFSDYYQHIIDSKQIPQMQELETVKEIINLALKNIPKNKKHITILQLILALNKKYEVEIPLNLQNDKDMFLQFRAMILKLTSNPKPQGKSLQSNNKVEVLFYKIL